MEKIVKINAEDYSYYYCNICKRQLTEYCERCAIYKEFKRNRKGDSKDGKDKS